MKITKNKLKQIIKEELNAMQESPADPGGIGPWRLDDPEVEGDDAIPEPGSEDLAGLLDNLQGSVESNAVDINRIFSVLEKAGLLGS